MNSPDDNLDDEVICLCSGTTRGQIKTLIQQGLDVEAISRWTGALSGCAGCESDVAELLAEFEEQKSSDL